jgi:hypothetical protein
MSDFVEWIGAQADERDPGENVIGMRVPAEAKQSAQDSFPGDDSWVDLRGHNFPGQPVFNEALFEDPLDRNPDLWLYRKRTVGLLRRYVRFSLETGRLPSLVGREFFRARMTSYTASTFEDRVIFVRDIEKCLDRLEYWDQQMIARIIMQEHSQEQAARILHCGLRTVERRLPQVLDLLSEDFLRVGLLTVLPSKRGSSQ